MKIFKKWWFWVIIVAVIAVIGSVGSNQDESQPTQAQEQKSEQLSTSDTSKQAEQPKTEESPKTQVHNIGDSVEADQMVFTVNGVREIPGNEFFKPQEGNIYYAIDVTVENKSNESKAVSSVMMFDLIDSEGYSYNITIGPETKGQLDGEIAAGRKLRGELAYEIPKNATGLELEIDPSVWGTGKIIYKLDR